MRPIRLRSLRAVAGPRITASSASHAAPQIVAISSHLRPHAPRFSARHAEQFGLADYLELLPWPLVRRRRHAGYLWALTAALVSLILALFVMPLLLALAPISVVILTLSREMQSSARRSRHHLRAVIKAIRAGRPAAETRHDVEEALQLDPDNDAARLLLACLMVEAGQERSALLQLAPLRDHHPDSGEIVFVAAAAYLHMHKPGEALRMLEALDITRDHRCYLAATRMLSDCRRLLGNTKTNELPVWGSPLAEDLREFF